MVLVKNPICLEQTVHSRMKNAAGHMPIMKEGSCKIDCGDMIVRLKN